ncbi:MAG: hydrogenase maturation nickel metallochaperone HypA [Gemmiger sp.]|nr:hydrogenase maturation nickel metallochaperone HypA [Gemmiger sp.]
MHEMAITESLLRITLAEAAKAGATRVTALHIKMGAYADIVPTILREYFAIAARGTAAEGARVEIGRIPVTMRCRTCGWQGPVDKLHIRCGGCAGTDLQLLTGREFYLESLEAE